MNNRNYSNGTLTSIRPTDVPGILGEHMLVDMLDFVVDLKRSEGVYIYDSKSNRRFLDFFTFVASMPLGMNHPKITTPEFMEKLAYVAVNKPTNSDVYTVEMAEFLGTFSRVASPTTSRMLSSSKAEHSVSKMH